MGKWEMMRLGDVCEIVSGTTPSTNNPDLWDGDVKWITPAEISSESYFIYDTERYISKKAGIKPFPAGTVILSSRAPIGKVAIAGTEMCCNQGFKNLICSEKIHNRYLYRYLKNKTEYLNSLGRGATFKEISKAIVEQIEIPLPSLPVQQQIADVLDRANNLIEKRKTQIDKLDLLVKSQFIEMFGDPVTNPKGWEVRELGDVFDVGSSKRVYQEQQTAIGVPFLRISDLVERIEGNMESCSLFISEEQYDAFMQKRQVPNPGDILVTSRGTLGRCYIVQETDKFYFQDGMISWLKKGKAEISSIFIKHLFTMQEIKRQINESPTGTTVGYLSIARLGKIMVLYPDIEVQSQFEGFVQQVETQKSLFQQSLAKLEQNYKSLMQKCFRGEVF